MPYLRPLEKGERKCLLEDGTILGVLEEFAKSGYIHNDIKWRHFGSWKSNFFLIDLGDITEEHDKQRIDDWVHESMAQLQSKVNESALSTPSSKKVSGNKRRYQEN
jgi:hypothetical protein